MSGGPPPLPLIAPPAWLGTPLGQARAPRAPAPAPAGGGSGSGGTAVDDAKKLADIKELLKKSPTGAAAVKFMEDKSLATGFASGGGSFWDGSKMVINRDHTTERAALAVVHEVNHAKATRDGTTPDIGRLTRDDYVKGMLAEEVRGTVDSIKTKNELIAAGVSITATYPLEEKYNEAYKKATDDLTRDKPSSTPADLKAAGEKAGHDAVMKGFKEGAVVTSIPPKDPY